MSTFKTNTDERNVTYVTLDRPDIHNAFNEVMIKELTAFFIEISKKKQSRLIVLSGEGKSFCAGADLNWMKKMKDYSEEENFKDSLELRGLFESIDKCTIPVLAKVHGAALGGGAGLISACDYVIAVDSTKIGFTEARLGLLPAVISPFVVAKIGHSNARAHFITGEIFNAQRAYDMNLVHKVCTQEELDAVTDKQIKRFLSAGPFAAREAKELAHNINILPKDELGNYTCKTISRIRIGSEAQEGMNALLEKRKPNWMES